MLSPLQELMLSTLNNNVQLELEESIAVDNLIFIHFWPVPEKKSPEIIRLIKS